MKRSAKHKMTKEEKAQRTEQRNFFKKIRQTFCDAGFTYVPTVGRHFKISGRDIEIDSAYIYQNIILLCEDTVEQGNGSAHVIKKNEAAGIINDNRHEFLDIFVKMSEHAKNCRKQFNESRIKIFSLYFSKYHTTWDDDEIQRFKHLILIPTKVLEYFRWLAQGIKISSVHEIFRFLKLNSCDVGQRQGQRENAMIEAPIIHPTEFVGGDERVRIVSFMMSAKDLLMTAYVMRKDGWEVENDVYQRLVDKTKIRKIRQYLLDNKATFYNNIIVVLPDVVKIVDKDGDSKSIFKTGDQVEGARLQLPKEYNTIGVIDGQHRVYAYHEGGYADDRIKELREKLHLLVTGIVFPPSMPELDRRMIQSKLFLDINANAKPVSAALLLHIKKMQDPFADTSIAQDVIECLNRNGVFKDRFQESALSQKGIPTASIIKFALRYLVTLTPSSGKGSFISSWSGNAERLKEGDGEALKEYVKYCAECLSKYFAGIKQAFGESWKWDDASTLLPSVVTINGFLIALCKKLVTDRPHDVEYYRKKFKQFKIDFSRSKFEYRSSQYHKFAQRILEDVWR